MINENNKIVNSYWELFNIDDFKRAQDALLQWVSQYSDTELGKLWGVAYYRIKRLRAIFGLVRNRKGDIIISPKIVELEKR